MFHMAPAHFMKFDKLSFPFTTSDYACETNWCNIYPTDSELVSWIKCIVSTISMMFWPFTNFQHRREEKTISLHLHLLLFKCRYQLFDISPHRSSVREEYVFRDYCQNNRIIHRSVSRTFDCLALLTFFLLLWSFFIDFTAAFAIFPFCPHLFCPPICYCFPFLQTVSTLTPFVLFFSTSAFNLLCVRLEDWWKWDFLTAAGVEVLPALVSAVRSAVWPGWRGHDMPCRYMFFMLLCHSQWR